MRRWWTEKYQQSPKSVEYNSYTLFELITEYYEDLFVKNPKEALKVGGVIETGDDLIDRWEKQIADGQTPDLEEGVSEEEQAEISAWAKQIDSIESSQFDESFHEEF